MTIMVPTRRRAREREIAMWYDLICQWHDMVVCVLCLCLVSEKKRLTESVPAVKFAEKKKHDNARTKTRG